MATGNSGSFVVSGNNGFSGQIIWSEEYDIATNASVLSINLQLKSTTYFSASGNDYRTYWPNGTIKVDGESALTMNSVLGTHALEFMELNRWWSIRGNPALPITYGPIYHNQDGKKTVTIAVNISLATIDGLGGSGSRISGSQEIVLTDIPRGATITTAPNFDDENPPTILYNNPAGAEVDSVQACIETVDGSAKFVDWQTLSKTDNSYTFNFDKATLQKFWSANTTGDTFQAAFRLKTLIAGVEYLSDPVVRTVTIVNSNPVVIATATESNEAVTEVTGSADVWVRYKTNLSVAFSYTFPKGASLKSHSVKCGEQISSANPATFKAIDNGVVEVSVTDSRNHTTTIHITKTLVPYVKVTCSLDDVKLDTAGNLTVKVDGSFYDGDIGDTSNVLTLNVQYRLKGAGDWVDGGPLTATKGAEAYTGQTTVVGLDPYGTYEVRVQAGDIFDTAFSAVRVVISMPVFDWGKKDFNFNVPVWFSGGVPLLNGVNIGSICFEANTAVDLPIYGCCVYMICAVVNGGGLAIYSATCDSAGHLAQFVKIAGNADLTASVEDGVLTIVSPVLGYGWYIVSGANMPAQPEPDPEPDPEPTSLTAIDDGAGNVTLYGDISATDDGAGNVTLFGVVVTEYEDGNVTIKGGI